MPELPEVETTIRGLKFIINSSILNIKIHTPKLRFFIPKNISLLNNIKVQGLKRIGKYIIINLENEFSIIIHLGMSGRLRLIKAINFNLQKHDHCVILTNKKYLLVFNDPRKFGFIDYQFTSKIHEIKYFLNLGKDGLSKSLNGQYLYKKINKSVVPIKQILLNQNIISGIGNIYASEILYNAKISPFDRGKDLSLIDCKQIVISTKKILKKAIAAGGSTLKNYVSTNGTIGNFQNNFKVYNNESKKIHGNAIKKVIQYGRSTYYCPKIQKNK